MREESQIRHKLRQLMFRHRKRYLQEQIRPHPHLCVHNRTLKDYPLSFCNHPTQEFRVCDPEKGGLLLCQSCPLFTRKTPLDVESLKADFLKKMMLPLVEMAKDYPDVVALRWVLEEQAESLPEREDEC